MPSSRPSVVIFDVNETLLDITTLEPLFERVFGDAAVMREWFAQLILYSEALTLAGLYRPFGPLAGAVLRMVGDTRQVAVGEDDVAELGSRVSSMPAHSDAGPALTRLAEAGFRLVTLTNSAPGPDPAPLARAGLEEHFEQCFSVDTVARFKPAADTYRSVADALGVALESTCLVAAHTWDTIGAQAAGGRAALVTRPGNAVLALPGVPQPDIVGGDLTSVCAEIIDRWGTPDRDRCG